MAGQLKPVDELNEMNDLVWYETQRKAYRLFEDVLKKLTAEELDAKLSKAVSRAQVEIRYALAYTFEYKRRYRHRRLVGA